MPPKPNPDSLYVHVPFCASICPYCDFPKVLYRQSWAKPYLDALEAEAKARDCGLFSTVYVGGGTPSCLSDEDFAHLLGFLKEHLREGGEFSVECNPDSLTKKKIALLQEHGVNRVSIGVQSSVSKSLKTLGRHHDFKRVKEAIEDLRMAGINNINVDWMYGFPGQSDEDLRQDIKAFLSLDVPHISAYSLILEEGTVYAVKGLKPLDDDTQQDYFEAIKDALTEHGYLRYEISNFAREGYPCRHNLTYWNDLPYLAIGLGAAGYLGDSRYRNTLNLSSYIKGEYEGEVERLTEKDKIEEFFLTTLRLVKGFPVKEFIARFGMDGFVRYKQKFNLLYEEGLLEFNDGHVACTSRGLDVLDSVLLSLFE